MAEDTEKDWTELRHWIIKTLEHVEERDENHTKKIRDIEIELAVVKTKVVFYGAGIAAIISALSSVIHWLLTK